MTDTNNTTMDPRLTGLYVLTDQHLTPADKINACVAQAIDGGCSVVQYRDKTSSPAQRLQQAIELNNLCRNNGVLFIINDDITLAKKAGAHGIHIGKHDADLQQAREILGADSVIGVSCYNDLQLAIDAEKQGANYVAFGRFFDSTIKPDAVKAKPELLTEANQYISIPVAAIGGINLDNATGLINAGADMLAVISSVFAQKDIETAARNLTKLIQS